MPLTLHNSEPDGSYGAIRDAASLMLKCAGYMADRDDEANSWTIFYAVDVDVIKLFLSPRKRTEYASVFGNAQDLDTRILLAGLLSDYLFTSKRDSPALRHTLLLIKPHDRELSNLVFHLASDVVDAAERIDRVPATLFSQLPSKVTNVKSLAAAQWLIENAPEIVSVFDKSAAPVLN